MEEAAGNIVLEVGKSFIAPIGRQFMYLYNYKSNFDNLKKEVGKLKDARDEVKDKVVAAEKNVEKIKQNVKDWQKDVDSIIDEAENLIQEKANSRCFNLITCYKSSRKSSKKVRAVTELLQEKETFGEVSLPTTHEDIRLTNKDYEEFESRISTLNDVLKALDDGEVGIIGVYGMGGIGKTTLVKEVGQQAKKKQLLDEVVFLEVSENPDAKKIQDELANQLGLKFDTEAERASKLYARLKNDKKILVILDNIWKRLNLETLGIPCGDDRGGCKVLLTARDLNVLLSMDSIKNFSMGFLSEEEAWSLFKKMAGDIDQTSKLNYLPNDVCKECRGLPIVITTIARALRNKRRRSQWEDALRELRMPSPTKFTGLLEKEYSKIALSYNYLKGDELKKTFLICCLMVNNISISDLFKYIMGLEILEGVNLTLEQARNRLDSLVCELKDSCLLLDGPTGEQFSMHDVVRAVGITIAYRDEHVFTERNDMMREWTNKDELKKCTKISLADSNMISQLWPQGLDCPKLEFFRMRMKDSSFKISENFFVGMGNLKVLYLFNMKVLSLPVSLGLLINLQTLCLNYGKFDDIIIIGGLRTLKILSLQHCKIKQLTKEIGKLTQLRLLDLSYCELEVIAPNVISSLFRLEELYMSGCSILWKVEGLEELKHLSHLNTLEIDISDDKILPKDLFSKKLEKYKISIGDKSSEFGGPYIHGDSGKYMRIESFSFNKPATSRMLKLKLNSIIWLEELQCFKNVEFLCLDKFQGIKNDVYELDKEGFSQLKHLHVHNNPNILGIVDSTKCIPHDVFPLLESLILFNLINLETICYGQPTTKSFYNLTVIEVQSCAKLENIFSFSNASRSLPQLQRIRVEDCKNMNEIFAVEREDRANKNEVIDKIEFFQLRFLTLINLPMIANFYSEANTTSTLQMKESTINLQSNDIYSKDELVDTVTPFFNKKVVFPSLEALKLGAINSEKIWDNQLPTISCYQNLTSFIVDGCQKLKFVFPSSIIKSFEQLQHLEISYCKELKEIVADEEGAEATVTFIFPRVAFLKLKDLPELTTFYQGKHTSEWPMLKKLEVCNCHKLHIFTSEYKVDVPNLEAVELRSVNSEMIWDSQLTTISSNSEMIWDSQLTTISSCYQNLTRLIVDGCEKLKYVFPSSMAKSFERLEHLEIRNCRILKEIVGIGVEAAPTFVFPRITFLKLEDLPELATLYPRVHISEWPLLKKLEVCNCDKIKIFNSEYMSFDENNEGQLDTLEPQSLFLAKKINPNLEELILSRVEDLITLQHQFPENFFCRCTVEIKRDKSTSIPVGILQRLINLEKIILRDSSYKEIFTYGEDEKYTETPIEIKSLELRSLSDVKCFWRKDSKLDFVLQNLEILEVYDCDRMMNVLPSSASFRNLTVLKVDSCYGLVNLVTPSLAKNLVQLREMKIESCKLVIEIVSNEKDVAAEDEIVFSKLKLLSLEDLESLTCFCSGNYTLKFPSLKELTVCDCPNMKTFSGGVLSTPSLEKVQQYTWKEDEWCWEGDLNTTIQHLHKEAVKPNSEELTVSGKNLTFIWQDQIPENQFSKVKVLEIIKDESSNIPIEILKRFNNLKKLILKPSSYKEMFSCGEEERHIGSTLTQIKELELWGLFNLKYMWKPDSYLDSILQNLEMLDVNFCHNLINLAPSSTNFGNLTTLEVWHCDGLINLVSSSTAKSLVRLEKITIRQCEMMIEVVSNERYAENKEIVFHKLNSLSLDSLKSLTSFYSGNYTFKFPSLEYLDVENCPKMKTFSRGVLSAPSLQKVIQDWNDKVGCWEGDLNTTIQHLHKKLSSEKDLGQTSMKSPE